MAGPELVFDVCVVAAALIDVVDHQGNRSAGGDLPASLVLEHAGEEAHDVGFAALGREPGLPRTTLVQKDLDILRREWNAGRAPVNDAADGRAMAFPPCGDPEQVAEGVVGHPKRPYCGAKAVITDTAGRVQRGSGSTQGKRGRHCFAFANVPFRAGGGYRDTSRRQNFVSHVPFI